MLTWQQGQNLHPKFDQCTAYHLARTGMCLSAACAISFPCCASNCTVKGNGIEGIDSNRGLVVSPWGSKMVTISNEQLQGKSVRVWLLLAGQEHLDSHRWASHGAAY